MTFATADRRIRLAIEEKTGKRPDPIERKKVICPKCKGEIFISVGQIIKRHRACGLKFK